MNPDDLLTAEEVEQMLRVGKGWAYRNRHRIPHIRLGQGSGALRFPRGEVEQWLDRQVQRPMPPAPTPAPITPRRRRA